MANSEAVIRRRVITQAAVCLTGIMDTLISGIVNYETAATFFSFRFFFFSPAYRTTPLHKFQSGWKH